MLNWFFPLRFVKRGVCEVDSAHCRCIDHQCERQAACNLWFECNWQCYRARLWRISTSCFVVCFFCYILFVVSLFLLLLLKPLFVFCVGRSWRYDCVREWSCRAAIFLLTIVRVAFRRSKFSLNWVSLIPFFPYDFVVLLKILLQVKTNCSERGRRHTDRSWRCEFGFVESIGTLIYRVIYCVTVFEDVVD